LLGCQEALNSINLMVVSISKFVESVSNIIKCGKPEIQMLHNPNLKMVNNMKPQIKKKNNKST
jgi:hypothetical protein